MKFLMKLTCAIGRITYPHFSLFHFAIEITHRLFLQCIREYRENPLDCFTHKFKYNTISWLRKMGSPANIEIKLCVAVERSVYVSQLIFALRNTWFYFFFFFICNIECQTMRMPLVSIVYVRIGTEKIKMAAICGKRQRIRHCDWRRRRVRIELIIVFIWIW